MGAALDDMATERDLERDHKMRKDAERRGADFALRQIDKSIGYYNETDRCGELIVRALRNLAATIRAETQRREG